MKKNYVTPVNEIINLNMSEGILAKSDYEELPLDKEPGDSDTKKKKEIWEGEGNIWE